MAASNTVRQNREEHAASDVTTIDLGAEEDSDYAAGSCARDLFSYRGEYRATRVDVDRIRDSGLATGLD